MRAKDFFPPKSFVHVFFLVIPSVIFLLYFTSDYHGIEYSTISDWFIREESSEMETSFWDSSLMNISLPSNYTYCYTRNGSNVVFFQFTNNSEWHPLEMCAIRSAAIKNNSTGVCVLTKSEMKPDPKLVPLTNVEMVPLDPELIFAGTPLEKWYEEYASNSSRASTLVMWELSDALRYAYIYKFGGKYLDTDMLTLRDVPMQNVVAWQGDGKINGAMFFFEPRHPFAKVALDKFLKYFKPGGWESVGPDMITKIHRLGLVDKSSYAVLPSSMVYPLSYYKIEYPFLAEKSREVRTATAGAYTLHLWRYMFRLSRSKIDPWNKDFIIPNGSFMQEFMQTFC